MRTDEDVEGWEVHRDRGGEGKERNLKAKNVAVWNSRTANQKTDYIYQSQKFEIRKSSFIVL